MTAPITGYGSNIATTAASKSVTNSAGGTMGKDSFMKLLVAQMQHQDPLNPTDGSQMAAQLAQFSQLEQLQNIGTKLDTQAAANTAMAGAVNDSTAIGLLGKNVTVESDTISVGANATKRVAADIAGAGGDLTVRIVDSNGNTLSSSHLGNVLGGTQTVSLENLTSNLPSGNYKVVFDVRSAAGATAVTNPATRISAHIDGVGFGTNGAVVSSGTRQFPIATVVSVDATN